MACLKDDLRTFATATVRLRMLSSEASAATTVKLRRSAEVFLCIQSSVQVIQSEAGPTGRTGAGQRVDRWPNDYEPHQHRSSDQSRTHKLESSHRAAPQTHRSGACP